MKSLGRSGLAVVAQTDTGWAILGRDASVWLAPKRARVKLGTLWDSGWLFQYPILLCTFLLDEEAQETAT